MTICESNRWYPIGMTTDLPFRHVFHTALGGQELAVWRDDNGLVNAWENRCPHRGLRLSLGVNLGDSVRCQYHGWTYESGSGSCTFVPAHRDQPPAAARVYTFAVRETDDMLWASLGAPQGEPPVYGGQGQGWLSLRSLPVDAPVQKVMQALHLDYSRFACCLGVESKDLHILALADNVVELTVSRTQPALRFYLQPHSDSKTVIHAQVSGLKSIDLHFHELFVQVLNEFRRNIEKHALLSECTRQVSEGDVVVRATNTEVQSEVLRRTTDAIYQCRISSRNDEANGIISLNLKPTDRAMPVLTPGMHVSVKTPSGLVRQYSVVNAPDERDAFIIGVKKEEASRGGSLSMHEHAHEGGVLHLTVPRNGFPLKRTGRKPILVAGGIGITPILAMAQSLWMTDMAFELHYFARSEEHVPFKDRLQRLNVVTHLHIGLDATATEAKIIEIMSGLDASDIDVYVCGPGPMIQLVQQSACAKGVGEEAIRFEYFKNEEAMTDDGAFDVTLAGTGQTITVPVGKSILEACAEHGVEIESSCEQGVCGTCITKVLSGDIEHRDLYLSRQEKESGKLIMPCVSRAKTGNLILDL